MQSWWQRQSDGVCVSFGDLFSIRIGKEDPCAIDRDWQVCIS